MKFLNPVAPRWYARLNEATLSTSVLVIGGYGALRYLVDQNNDLELGISPLAAGLAGLALVYAAVGYRLFSAKLNFAAGLVSYLLMSATIAAIVAATGGFESQYLMFWVVVILLSGMFGLGMLAAVWGVTHLYFALLIQGAVTVFGMEVEIRRTVIYLIAIELPFLVSFFFWYGQGVNREDESEDVSTEIGTQHISQGMLISSIAEGVAVIDEEFRIQVFNPAAAQTTGWSPGDAKGIDYRTVLNLTDQAGAQLLTEQDPIQRVFQKAETIVDNQVKLRTRNNKDIDLTFVASPITNASGSTIAAVAVFRDVSAERSQERQRAEFISTASHEMRTPVAAIEGYLALAMNDQVSKIDSKAREYLEKAHSSTQHLGKLFQDLLTAAKSEDGRLQNRPVVTEVGSFVDQIVGEIKFTAEKKGLILEYTGAPSDTSVAGAQSIRPIYFAHIDPERMHEVITNLFDNAVKYTEEGKITVNVIGDDANVVIAVADTGPGIPQEDIPHLFQKFYRVDSTATRQIGGTGLGLFIARKVVEMNNGKIWVESQVDKGSTFFISLPRLSSDKAQLLQQKEAAAATPLANVTKNAEI